MSEGTRIETGRLIRRLQRGLHLSLPHSRPMPVIGGNCHELRVPDRDNTWRIIYRIDADAIVVATVFAKRTQQTPDHEIKNSKSRLATYGAERGAHDQGKPKGHKLHE